MEFKDYKPEELIGKTVLIKYKYSREISTIERITKTAFKVKDVDGLFNFSGWLKGGGQWNIVYCNLISDDEATQLRKEWTEKKEGKAIIELFDKLKTELTIEQLRSVKEIIQPHIPQKEL